MKDIVKQALIVGKKYPVFPTDGKRPCWSNKAWAELTGTEVGRGEGGYKLASQDPETIKKLFSHPRATEIAVPMGEMSRLMCVDLDLYKPGVKEWVTANEEALGYTRSHSSRSGGLHMIYKQKQDNKLPAQIIDGVDIKAGGTGYICWPPTDGYEPINDIAPKKMPAALRDLIAASVGAGKSNGAGPSGTFNEATDDELVKRIVEATDFYGSLRTLSWRLVSRGNKADDIISALSDIMRDSEATAPGHPRHADWLERILKIPELVSSAVEKQGSIQISDDILEKIGRTNKLFDPGENPKARPIGPQRETTQADIEKRVAELDGESGGTGQTVSGQQSSFTEMSVAALLKRQIEPLTWIIPGMLPEGATASLAGTSNVGKTRWLAALTVLLASGKTELLGLPKCVKPIKVLWIANEERVDDIARRCKAVALQHGLKKSGGWVVRGKDEGMLQLVSVNELGQPELNEENIALLVAEIRKCGAQMFVLDPYVTISSALDENSAMSAIMITKAMHLVTQLTGATGFHSHHTPKDRSKDGDWYRGDSGGWRGSGAIFSPLDCAFTLSHFYPANGEQRKRWKQLWLKLGLSRYIVLDSAKVREGRPIEPVVYELVGQAMQEGEGDPIGVCRLSDDSQATNSLLDGALDGKNITDLGVLVARLMGAGTYKLSALHKKVKGQRGWPGVVTLRPEHSEKIHAMFGTPVMVPGFSLWLEKTGKRTNAKWVFHIEERK